MGDREGSRAPRLRRSFTFLIAAVVVVSGACSTEELPDGPSAGAVPSNEPEAGSEGTGEKDKEGTENDESGDEGQNDSSGGEETDATDDENGSDEEAETAESEPGSVSVPDPTGDLERSGDPPGYIDIVAASVEDLGKAGRFTFEMGVDVPERMNDRNTTAIVDFRIKPPQGDEVSINAVGDDQGWRAAIDARPIRGLQLSGRTIQFVIPWNEIGDPSRFKWAAHSSWTENAALGTEFGFDTAPNARRANFRRP
jgi:hypothetical protein